MRHFAALLLLAAFSFALPACAQKATPHASTTKKASKNMSKKAPAQGAQDKTQPAPNEAGPVLTFERTPCFGICPAYAMQVFADGRVAYEGRRYVPKLGAHELRLPATTVAEMLRTARDAHFEQFQAEYSRGTTDLPSTVIAVRQPNGQLKTVTVEEGAPASVQMLVTYLASKFDALAELGGAEK